MDTKRRGELLKLYHWLASARALCAVMRENRAKIHGPLLTAYGNEGMGIGIMWGLYRLGIAEKSWVDIDYRTVWSVVIAKSEVCGVDLSFELMKHYYLKATGPYRGRDVNYHIGFPEQRVGGFDLAHTGAMLGVSAGRAKALRILEYNDTEEAARPVVISCIGEGAAQQGLVHEVMNWIAAENAKLSKEELAEQELFLDNLARKTGVMRGGPITIAVNVNEKSIYTDAREEHGNAHLGRPSHLAQRALGFPGWVGIDVNGEDVLAIADAVEIAAQRSQKQEGSTLIIFHTYRRTPHNEDQFPTLTPKEKEELEASWDDEPLKQLKGYLVTRADVTLDDLAEIDERALAEMRERSERALAEPDVTIEEDAKDQARFAPHVYTLAEIKAEEDSKLMGYREVARMVLDETLSEDSRALFFGEDVAHPFGGVMGIWRGLTEKFGNARVFSAPISEEALVGILAGLSSMGLRPWAEGEYAPFLKRAAVQLNYVIGPVYYQKKLQYPFVLLNHFGVVTPNGGGGQCHSDCTESDFFHNQGWKIVFPADAYDLAGLLRAAHEDPNPVVVFMQIFASRHEFRRRVPSEPYMIPLGKAAVKRAGKDITIIAYGACPVQAALNEAEELAKEGIACEVIDLRTVVPLDLETIAASAKKTGRVLIMHEASRESGLGVYIKDNLDSDLEVWSRLRAPITIIASKDVPIPGALVLEWDRLPFEMESGDGKLRSHRLAEAVRHAMRF